jgi:hypothetical protein
LTSGSKQALTLLILLRYIAHPPYFSAPALGRQNIFYYLYVSGRSNGHRFHFILFICLVHFLICATRIRGPYLVLFAAVFPDALRGS